MWQWAFSVFRWLAGAWGEGVHSLVWINWNIRNILYCCEGVKLYDGVQHDVMLVESFGGWRIILGGQNRISEYLGLGVDSIREWK